MRTTVIITGCILILLSLNIFSKNLYISDSQKVPVRSGNGLKHPIIKMISPGSYIPVVRSDNKTGYSLIQYSKTRSGWVRTNSLVPTKPASSQLAVAKKEIEELKSQIEALKKQPSATEGSNTDTDPEKSSAGDAPEEKGLSDDQPPSATLTTIEAAVTETNKRSQSILEKIEMTLEAIKNRSDSSAITKQGKSLFVWGAVLAIFSFFSGILVTRINARRGSIFK